MSSRLLPADLAAALVSELTRALHGTVPDVAMAVAAPVRGAGWQFAADALGSFDGSIALWVDRRGVAPLMARLLAVETPTESEITTRLCELWANVVAAVLVGDAYQGITTQAPTVSFADAPPDAAWLDITVDATTARVAIAVRDRRAAADAGEQSHLEALLDIDLPLVVRFARTVMSIKSLASVGPGTVVDMERSPDAPVDLLVGNRVIAQGEVVVVGGNYGVRVTRLCHPMNRIRPLEG